MGFAAATFLAAAWVVWRELRGSSIFAIEQAVRSTPSWAIIAALAATAVSYLFLAGSEYWALACVGRRLPARRVLLVTGVAYAISNGLGFSAATGGAARLRFYRAWGLDVAQIAAVTVLAGTAVTLSGCVAAAIGLALSPNLGPAGWAAAALLAAPVWLWLGRLPARAPFLHDLALTTPALGLRAAALGSGLLDWLFSGLALFVLNPGVQADQFAAFLVVFVLGSVVSAASGVPGGVGVFEAVVLSFGRQFALPHETVAALVLYRLIYALGPLGVVAVGLAVQQARALGQGRAAGRLREIADAIAPAVMSALVFALGAGLLLAAARAPLHWAAGRMLVAAAPAAPLATSLLGAMLVLAASALWRRQEAAYFAALALLIAGAGLDLWLGLDLVRASPFILMALVLAPSRFVFDRRSALLRDIASAPWLLAAGLAGVSALALVFALRQGAGLAEAPWWSFLRLRRGGDALSVAAGLACLGLMLAVARLLAASRAARETGDSDEIARARRIIMATGAVSCDAWLALLGDKSFVFSPSGRSFVMYRPHGGRWLAMGDPVGPADDRPAAIEAFARAADEAQCKAAFYAVENASLPDLIEAGFLVRKIGESAEVDVSTFELKGKAHADIRHAAHHASRAGLSFQVLDADAPETPWPELRKVSQAWLSAHSGAEKTFTLGRFDRAYLSNFPIALLRLAEDVVAFANVLVTPDGLRFGPDLMRCRPDAPAGATDALFAALIEWGRQRGYRWFELGMAPLSGLETGPAAPLSQRLQAWVYGAGESLYGFRGLRAYKEKFTPHWRPVYLAAAAGLSPMRALADVALLTGGGVGRVLRRPSVERHAPEARRGNVGRLA